MVLRLDQDVRNADWTKRFAWDIPATNADELRAFLDARGMTFADFKELPVYEYAHVALPWIDTLAED